MKAHLLSDMRDEIKTGDLMAFRVRRYGTLTSFALWLYQKITKVRFSHVGVAMKLGEHLFIVEAISPRVTITPISKVKEFYLVPVKIKTNEENQVDYLLDFVEMNYSLISLVTHYFGFESPSNKVYCSELASGFYYHVGLLHERESGHTPEKLTEAVLAKSDVKEPIHIVIDRGNLK